MAAIRTLVGFATAMTGALLRAVLWLLTPWRWFRRRSVAVPVAAATPVERSLPPVAPEPDWPEMPRIGKPGTATDAQVEALLQIRLVPAPPCRDLHDYSKEEAQLFLDAIAFARAVAGQVTDGEDEEAPPEILTELLNDLMGETLADDELRAFATRWARNGAPLPIRENSTFERARAVVLRHWQPPESVSP